MKRFLLDMVLLLLILLVMGFHFLPQLLHEVLGLGLLAGTLWHLWLNRSWFCSLRHGKWNCLRLLQVMAGLFLLISFFIAMATGIVISNHVFRDFWIGVPLHRSIFVHQLHIASAYGMLILMGMHIGANWRALWQRLQKLPGMCALQRHSSLRFWLLVLVGWSGVLLSRLDHVGDRLFMKHIFGTLTMKLPAGVYYILLLCFMGLYAMGVYYLQKYWQNKNREEDNR